MVFISDVRDLETRFYIFLTFTLNLLKAHVIFEKCSVIVNSYQAILHKNNQWKRGLDGCLSVFFLLAAKSTCHLLTFGSQKEKT